MALESLYFKHDFNAHNDPKLAKILKEMQYEGVGMFWTLCEIFYTNGGYINPKDIGVICWDNHMEEDKLMKLFEFAEVEQNEKGYYMDSILKRIDKREEYCTKQKENANKRWKKEKHVAPVPEWHEQYEKDKEKQHEQDKQEEEIKKKVSDRINKKYPDYLELMTKSIQDETTPEEEERKEKISAEEEREIEKELSKIKKNPFQE